MKMSFRSFKPAPHCLRSFNNLGVCSPWLNWMRFAQIALDKT